MQKWHNCKNDIKVVSPSLLGLGMMSYKGTIIKTRAAKRLINKLPLRFALLK